MAPVAIGLAGLGMAGVEADRRFDYYLDSAALPGGDGLTAETAFNTPAQWTALAALDAGKRLGIRRGSVFEGGSVNPLLLRDEDGIEIGAYGAGDPPLFDASAPATGWTLVGGKAKTYQATVTFVDSGINEMAGGMWEDGVQLSVVSSIDACEAMAGSCYCADWSAGTTLYVHPTGDTNPGSDGKAYRYAKHSSCLVLDGAGALVAGIHVRRPSSRDGALVTRGPGARWRDCIIEDGNRHNGQVGGDFDVRNCTFLGGRNDQEYGNPNGLVCFEADITGRSGRLAGCVFDGKGLAGGTAFLAHDSDVTHLLLSLEVKGCTFRNGIDNAIALSAATISVEDATVEGIRALLGDDKVGVDCTVRRARGSLGQLGRFAAASGIIAIETQDCVLEFTLPSTLPDYIKSALLTTSSVEVHWTSTGDSFVSSGSAENENRLTSLQNGYVVRNGSTIGGVWRKMDCIYVSGAASGDHNTFPAGADKWEMPAGNFDSLAAWQAGGSDLHSSTA